jgi:hypothetical protein
MKLTPSIKKDLFLKSYWLKEQLMEFCKEHKLSASGSKSDLTQRVVDFLDGKNPLAKTTHENSKPTVTDSAPLMRSGIIRSNYRNDEEHRDFFLSEIGKRFKFNVQFMNWMKESKGTKKYEDAIIEWHRIDKEKKNGKKFEIGSQFEYNKYTRDFFAANSDRTKEECIRCWNYKKGVPGSHSYNNSDLKVLEK